VRAIPWLSAVATGGIVAFAAIAVGCAGVLALGGCATAPATSIERGEASLLPETVVVPAFGIGITSAMVAIKGERKEIWVSSMDCDSGMGEIDVADGLGSVNNVVASGNRPGDRLFAALCAIRHRRIQEMPRGAPH
jgi:hypothetical protein